MSKQLKTCKRRLSKPWQAGHKSRLPVPGRNSAAGGVTRNLWYLPACQSLYLTRMVRL